MGPDEYAMQELFGPLGIDEVRWEGYSEQGMGHGMMNWPNPDQDVSLGYSLWMKPRDMLKIGEPYLSDVVVKARVEGEIKGEKVRIFKMRRRKHYCKTLGHRQKYTKVTITAIG